MKVMIIFDSRTGNTEKMAQAVAEGVRAENVEVDIVKVSEAQIDELLKVDGLIVGSPVYYGLPSSMIKEFFDASVKYHGKLDGKVGGAFACSGGAHSGGETTVMAINEALLIHGMVIQGTPGRNHYGPVSIGQPDELSKDACRKLGQRVANLTKRLHVQ